MYLQSFISMPSVLIIVLLLDTVYCADPLTIISSSLIAILTLLLVSTFIYMLCNADRCTVHDDTVQGYEHV